MLLLHKLSPYIQVNLKHHDFLMQSAQVKIWSICNLFPCNPRHGPLITWPRPIICSSHYINPCNSFDFIWISFIYFKHHFWNMFVTYTVGHYSSQTHMLHMSLNSQLINLCVHWLSMCVGTGEWLMESRVFFHSMPGMYMGLTYFLLFYHRLSLVLPKPPTTNVTNKEIAIKT